MDEKKILVFNENDEERVNVCALLRDEEFSVFETSRVLETVNLLKSRRFNLVLASNIPSDTEAAEFKAIVESMQPGVDVIFLDPLSNGSESVSMSSDEFRQFIQNSIRTESSLNTSLSDFKGFFLAFTERLIRIFSAGDRYLFNKDHLVATLSRKTALRMGLDDETVDTIEISALLKDLGMLGIQQQFLDDKKRLGSRELVPIKKHPMNTMQILKQIKFPWNVESIILQHHENYDGSGYPMGLRGRQISIGARIVHMADSFVAMTTGRPYRASVSRDDALQEIILNAGGQFDPEVAEAFQSVIGEELLPQGLKRSILVIERTLNITPLIKLSLDSADLGVITSNNSHEAKRHVKQNVPDLMVVDVEMLLKDTFVNFLNYFFEIPSMKECSFIFVLPGADYPRHFKGEQIRYLVKPVDMQDLSSTIKELLEEEVEPVMPVEESRGLMGSLADFSITDIVQILHMGLKTARVVIKRNAVESTLYMMNGNVVHSSTGELKGRKAFFEMLKWDTGDFHIQHGLTTEDRNINSETMNLLLEAARVEDEENRKNREALNRGG
jgi:response regulator RpfG family c-di-GMP phosphodiesterase